MESVLTTETLAACPVCSATRFTHVATYPDTFISSLCLWQCSNCQIVFLNPRLSTASTIQLENKSEVYNFADDKAEAMIALGRGLVAWMESHTGAPGAILDVGCNRGFLLEAARQRGWQPYGIEIAPVVAERARQEYGLTIYHSMDDLEEDLGAGFRFQLITAWHVLEHSPDPVAFLRSLAGHLCTGGILALEVPSYGFIDEFRKRDQFGRLICAVHNTYFTAETVRAIVDRAGMHVLEIHSNSEHLLLTVFASNTTHIRLHRMLRRIRSALPFVGA